MIAEGLWGLAAPFVAAIAALAAVKLSRSPRYTLVWLGTFLACCAAAAVLIPRLVRLTAPVFAFALLGNTLGVLMLYALVTRSISFDLLALVVAHRDAGVTERALLAGDPLNVRGRLAQLVRRGFVVTDGARFRTSRAGTLVARLVIAPLYRVRRHER